MGLLKWEYLKTSKSRGCGNISPQLKRYKNTNERKRKGKDKENYIFMFTLYLI